MLLPHLCRVVEGNNRGSWDRHTLRAEELARDVEGLAANDNDLLTVKELLGDNAREAAKKMALAIDDDLYESHQSANASVMDPSDVDEEEASQVGAGAAHPRQ